MLKEKYVLNNGLRIPKIGFGTWMINNQDATLAVQNAIKIGYRHIDTAEAYENEVGVGKGIRSSGVDRQDIFVTSKLRAEIKNYDEAVMAINDSLNRLNVGYIDLMLIHSPKPWANFLENNHYFNGNLMAWRALEDAYHAGKIKAIGVSNFEKIDLQNLINHGSVRPAVNQILSHIGNFPAELIDFSQSEKILVEAYSPFGHGEMFNRKDVLNIAKKYNVSIAQLSIKFLLELGLLPLPKSESLEHMKNNADVNFTITDNDFSALKSMSKVEYSNENRKFPIYKK